MPPQTVALIDRSIADLQDLASQFASDIQAVAPSVAPSQALLREKEALLTKGYFLRQNRAIGSKQA